MVPGNGKALIQLGHVKDLAKTLIKIPKTNDTKGQIYNISNEEYISLKGLVKLTAKITGNSANIQLIDTKRLNIKDRDIFPFDNQTYFTDITKAKKELNYSPKYDLTKGLSEEYKRYCEEDKHPEPDFSFEDKILKISSAP